MIDSPFSRNRRRALRPPGPGRGGAEENRAPGVYSLYIPTRHHSVRTSPSEPARQESRLAKRAAEEPP
ncbi:hypothetical protein ADK60_37715 [Streptomyces sp. XY431]|nr:hypothetical protein ADK60_37715 [Streptomyces sp. XY431]